jgi:hypothetical protein
MQTRARTRRHRDSEQFETPEWLERSFVLPLADPEVTDVPTQPVPHHDDDLSAGSGPPAVAPFVRPPSRDVDFARVIRRAEVARAAHRAATVSGGLTGLALIGYLVSASTMVLWLVALGVVVAATALAISLRLSAAPIPHVQR